MRFSGSWRPSTRSPPACGVSNAAFLTCGWDPLNLGREQEQVLASHGLNTVQIDHLAFWLTGPEAVASGATRGAEPTWVAEGGLQRLASEFSTLGLVLDPLVQTVHQGDAQPLAAWASARNVIGPFRRTELAGGPMEAAAPEGGELGGPCQAVVAAEGGGRRRGRAGRPAGWFGAGVRVGLCRRARFRCWSVEGWVVG